jgi:hypothetical protein
MGFNEFNIDSEISPFGISVCFDIFQCTNQRPHSTEKLHDPFQLPITYLNTSLIHPLSPIVCADLELVGTGAPSQSDTKDSASIGMYDYLFQPQHSFAKDMIGDWKEYYTTDTDYLYDTQGIIENMVTYESSMVSTSTRETPYLFDSSKCEIVKTIWENVKEDDSFLERYSFVEWDYLKSFNSSESFLQILSFANLSSPVMSLLIPFLFLIFPFIILMIQRIPITFEIYLATLKEIARNHFIGKAIFNVQHLSLEKAIYLLGGLSLYLLQIYQNVCICSRFYRNMQKINGQLCELRQYIHYSLKSMGTFCEINRSKVSYSEFIRITEKHMVNLRAFSNILEPIRPFSYSLRKIGEFGYLLKSLYEFYSNPEYDQSIRYSFGFEGYINNLLGVSRNLRDGKVAVSEYPEDEELNDYTKMESQYYPPTMDLVPVKNNCSLEKNAIITGPNASGKTTFLKTTTINIIFSQQVGCGFYRACSLKPYTHIHSYLNIPDTSGRDSLFQAESRRCKEIIDIILANQGSGHRHYCIFDELYSGTNPQEATKSAYAFLKYLGNFKNVDFILTTHYLNVCKRFRKSESIQNYKMDALIDADSRKIQYTYKIKRGISKIHGAVKILEEMEYPREILETIENYRDKL